MNRRLEKIKHLARPKVAALGAALWIILCAVPAMAQGGAAASETTVPGGVLVMITYVVLWVFFGGVLFAAIWRQRKLQRELDGLEDRIDRLLGTESN